tara:strand:+ start:5905 stop:7383 length:1479 start_codon:yes stop_codon:yes gene_type:complete
MKLPSLKSFWIWAALLASTPSVGQISLVIPADTFPPPVTEDYYLYTVDSLWLSHLDNISGLIATHADSTTLVLNESSLVFKQGLDSLNELTPLDLAYNSHLDQYIKEYLRYKHQLSKLLGLSTLYFPQMETILDSQDIPLEIKNLSVIESALNPNAKSYRGATGLWQFMLPTARECGLTINSYIDERKDPIKSTEAACLYLKKLYSIYGVWELSIAAYNCGPGNVNKAIRKAGGSKNFWKIRPFLPRETQKYVPRFIAMCYLMEFGDDHGIRPKELDLTFWQVDTVIVNEELRFDQITEKTSIAAQTLTTLNPQYKLKIIPTSSQGNILVLPARNSLEFAEQENEFRNYKPEQKHPYVKPTAEDNNLAEKGKTKTYYTVVSGDVLGTIAERTGVTVSQLKRWNSISGTRIKAGQKLSLYGASNKSKTPKAAQTNSTTTSQKGYTLYTVRKGDTLWDIAKLYSGVSPEDIKRLNKGINPKNLKMGYTLRIKKI